MEGKEVMLIDDGTICTNATERSMNHDSSELPFGRPEHFEEDHSWSVFSNSVFLFAGISYFSIGIWDYFFYPSPSNDDIAADDVTLTGTQGVAYSTLIACGVLGYFFDSIIDITWAKRIRDRSKAKKRTLKSIELGSPIEPGSDSLVGAVTPSTRKKKRFRPKKFKKKILKQVEKVRKHAAHRRDFYAACFFGAASFCALINWIYDLCSIDSRPPFFFFSVHFYLLSAIFALTGTRSRPIAFTFSLYDSDFLEDMGDIFFLIGSLVDTALCDFHFDDNTDIFPLISSFLWALDASLYLRSDAVVRMRLNREKWMQGMMDEAVQKSIEDDIDFDDDFSYSEMNEDVDLKNSSTQS